MDELRTVGKYNKVYDEVLGIDLAEQNIYQSSGLKKHIEKRGHKKALKYLECLDEILESPDYIGINPSEKGRSIELIKRYEDNILVGIKLDSKKDYLYVATMYEIQDAKIERRLHSGRLKCFADWKNIDK